MENLKLQSLKKKRRNGKKNCRKKHIKNRVEQLINAIWEFITFPKILCDFAFICDGNNNECLRYICII